MAFSLYWGFFLILYVCVRKNERERLSVCVGGFDLPRLAISRRLLRC